MVDNTDVFQYVTHYSTRTRQNTFYLIILELIQMYGIEVHVCKSTFNGITFIKARVAHSVEHRARNIKAVDSSPTAGKNFSYCILSLSMRSLQVDWSHIYEIKHDIHPR